MHLQLPRSHQAFWPLPAAWRFLPSGCVDTTEVCWQGRLPEAATWLQPRASYWYCPSSPQGLARSGQTLSIVLFLPRLCPSLCLCSRCAPASLVWFHQSGPSALTAFISSCKVLPMQHTGSREALGAWQVPCLLPQELALLVAVCCRHC